MKNLIGKQLPDLFEKRLIVARYFIKQKNKGIKIQGEKVYYMWNNFFRGDFQKANKYKLKWVDGKLISDNVPEKLLKNYNQKWKDLYEWIEKYIRNHSLEDCDKDIAGLRKKQYRELIKVFKPFHYYVMDTKANVANGKVASYHIFNNRDQYNGSYSKLLEYAENVKGRVESENSQQG